MSSGLRRAPWRARGPAIAVAIAAMVLTAAAQAQLLPPAASAETAPSATPLVLRPKPLELAHEAPQSGMAWNVVAILALVGGGAYYLRKRVRPSVRDDGRLTIVRRTAIGMRSELLVVNVEGQRLLLGVTPHTIQSLAVLDGEDVPALSPGLPGGAGASVSERFAAMLQAADGRPPSPADRGTEASPEDEDALSGQARGLLALRRRG